MEGRYEKRKKERRERGWWGGRKEIKKREREKDTDRIKEELGPDLLLQRPGV